MEAFKSLFGSNRPYVTYAVAGGAVVLTGVVIHHVVIKRLLFARGKTGQGLVVAPPDTAVIYQTRRGPYAPSPSPFPIKLETYCRLAKIPYLVDLTSRPSSRSKIPWMTYNGEVVEDSQFCMEYFNTKLGVDLNGHLGPKDRAVARFIQVLVDEHLYWATAMFRWVYYDKSFPHTIKKELGVSRPLLHMLNRLISKEAHGQGMGRHSKEEVKKIFMEDLQRLSDYLGDSPYMLGDRLCEADCSVFGLLSQMVWHSFQNDVITDVLKDHFPNLHQYVHRVRKEVWPDWDDCCKNKELITPLHDE